MVTMVSQISMAIVHKTISSVTISMSIVVKGIDVDTGDVMVSVVLEDNSALDFISDFSVP